MQEDWLLCYAMLRCAVLSLGLVLALLKLFSSSRLAILEFSCSRPLAVL